MARSKGIALPLNFDHEAAFKAEIEPQLVAIKNRCKELGIPCGIVFQYSCSEEGDGIYSGVTLDNTAGERMDASPMLIAMNSTLNIFRDAMLNRDAYALRYIEQNRVLINAVAAREMHRLSAKSSETSH